MCWSFKYLVTDYSRCVSRHRNTICSLKVSYGLIWQRCVYLAGLLSGGTDTVCFGVAGLRNLSSPGTGTEDPNKMGSPCSWWRMSPSYASLTACWCLPVNGALVWEAASDAFASAQCLWMLSLRAALAEVFTDTEQSPSRCQWLLTQSPADLASC